MDMIFQIAAGVFAGGVMTIVWGYGAYRLSKYREDDPNVPLNVALCFVVPMLISLGILYMSQS